MRSHLSLLGATGAAPGWQHLPQREEALGSSPQSSVSSETLRCLGTCRARAARGTRCRRVASPDASQDGSSASAPRTRSQPTPAHSRVRPSVARPGGLGNTPLRHCSQANMVPIQHRIILKVKIVYCCLCRNALNLHRLFSSFIWLLDYRHKKVTFTHLFSDITPFSLLLHSWYSPKPCWPTAPNLFYINTVNVSIGCSIVTKDLPK